MSTWKITVAALVCGLVFCGAAGAAELTLSLELVDYTSGVALTPGEIGALATGDKFGVAVYGEVANVPNGYGIAAASWTIYTPDTDGFIAPVSKLGKIPTTWGPTIDFSAQLGAARQDFANGLDPDGDLDAVGSSVAIFANNFDIGVGKTLIQRQEWQVLSDGALTSLAVFADPRAEYIDENAGDFTSQFDDVIGVGIGGGTANEVPTVALPDGDVLESGWNGPGGWNNPARSVTVTAVGDDPDGENGDLSYEWKMMAAGGGEKVLSETGAVLNLTLAEIESLGLPAYVGPGDASYDWTLSVTANDGTDTSSAAQIGVFVPEPTTMGLLGFGVLALLKRRRRA